MTNSPSIPFLDLVTVHINLETELCDVFRQSLRTAGFIGGPMVESFESEFAKFCDAQYCVGVGSGTDALRFALVAAGVAPGSIVITVPNTFIATTEAISQAGAVAHFVDVDERTYTLDPERLRVYLETQCRMLGSGQGLVHKKTGMHVSAVIPVHLYGQMTDMDAILDLADRYNLLVIEDACQAHGARYFSERLGGWRTAGSMGKAAAFSFYPGKNLGACGEAGAVITTDADIDKKIRMLRDHGQARKYFHDLEGYNGRLDAIQAGILKTKLAHLTSWNAQRRANMAIYNDLLHGDQVVVQTPYEPTWSKAVYHLYVIQVDERDALQEHLADAAIGTGIHYPIPLHLQKAYRNLGYAPGDFPVAEALARRILSLPLYPGIKPEQQSRVVETILDFFERTPARLNAFAATAK